MNELQEKPQYIRKYDFLDYHTKCSNLWFVKNQVFDSWLKNQTKTDHLDEEKEPEIESLDNLKRSRYDNSSKLPTLEPRLVEGLVIEKHFYASLQEFWPEFQREFKIDIRKFPDLKAAADFTQQLISAHPEAIIHQAVFLNTKLGAITICDAVIVNNKNLTIVEAKSSSATKLSHFLDVYYQYHLLASLPWLVNYEIDVALGIVRYEIAQQYQLRFYFSSHVNLLKSPVDNSPRLRNISPKILQELKSGEVRGVNITKLLQTTNLITFLNSELTVKYTLPIDLKNKPSRKMSDSKIKETILKMTKIDFAMNIKFLHSYLEKSESKKFLIEPVEQCKGQFRDCVHWQDCRKYFACAFPLMSYSGNALPFKKALNLNKLSAMKKLQIDHFQNELKNRYRPLVQKGNLIDYDKIRIYFKRLDKTETRIYFDFETINTAIRVVSNTLPYQQIITQCSVVILKNNLETMAENLIMDPLKLNQDWFKNIVDVLLAGQNYNDLLASCVYIVYNATFEKSRLKELKRLIDDPVYEAKIDFILERIVDLAILFQMATGNSENEPAYKGAIILGELRGFYSIKKVLELVPANILENCGVSKYGELKVNNGLQAQELTLLRFLNHAGKTYLDDDAWKNLATDLCVYCENDVRAMIATEEMARAMSNGTIDLRKQENRFLPESIVSQKSS